MKTIESKGIVRRIREDNEKFLVSFPAHDGYFNVKDQVLQQKIRQSNDEKKEITFSYDQDLTITDVR